MAKLPLRLLGLLLLTTTLSVASCQALFEGTAVPAAPQPHHSLPAP